MNVSIFGSQKDINFIETAIMHAQEAMAIQEVPIGAIIVNQDGTIIGNGFNQVERLHTQRAHAEIIAMENAAQSHANWRLDDCWLYVTLEPCSMCMNMAKLSRIAGIVYGAPSPLFGYRLDNVPNSWVYNSGMPIVIGNVKSEECAQLLRKFFKQQRNKGDGGE
jgi:tRNA(adenine34) deaminase